MKFYQSWGIVLFLASAVSCLGAPGRSPNVFKQGSLSSPSLSIRQLDAPLEVPGASALPGDYVLQNELATFVVTAPEHPVGNAASGGYLADAFMNDSPADQLGQLHLYLNDTYPRMARVQSARIAGDRHSSAAVCLEVTGSDTLDSSSTVTTTYTLRPNTTLLEIKTSLSPIQHNLGRFAVGDAFAWGIVEQYLPGRGFGASKGNFTGPWIGGQADGVAYGLFAGKQNLWGPVDKTWADISGTTLSVSAGKTASYSRFFVVGHDLAEVSGNVEAFRGEKLTRLEGTAIEKETNSPVDAARILITRDGKPFTVAHSRNGGRFSACLPPGNYTLTAQERARTLLSGPVSLKLPDQASSSVALLFSSPAVVNLRVRDSQSATLLPCKAIFLGRNHTPDPDFGQPEQYHTSNVIHIPQGQQRIVVAPGDYDVVLCRGLEYDVTTQSLELKPGTQTTVEASLQQCIQLPGYIRGDFHQHMKNSFDCAIPLEDRVISSVCEGLDFVAATDHNFITDLSPTIHKLGLERWIFSAIGDEMTPRKHFFGHINAFPLTVDTSKPRNGAIGFEKTIAARVFEEALGFPGEQVVQVNHPRNGDLGYFNHVHLSPEDGTTTHSNWSDRFTAVELFNGKRSTEDFDEGCRDWFNLLNLGYAFTATGNSDSHRIYDQEPGYPRNYIAIKEAVTSGSFPTVEQVVRGVNEEHAVFVTNGPLVSFRTSSGTSVGEMETRKKGPVEFEVQILGANFVQPSRVEFYGNGQLLKTQSFEETSATVKWQGSLHDEPTSDTWYTVIVRGSRSLSPVLSASTASGKAEPVTPLAFTNPIWIDRDGDGCFTAKNLSKLGLMREDRSAKALSQLDELTSKSQQRGQFKRRNLSMPE